MKTLAERLQYALDIRNMKQADLANITHIGKSSISTYLTGEYEPKQKNIYKIANALNVSEAWLMGYDVPIAKETATQLEDGGAKELNTIHRVLSADNKKRLEEYARLLQESEHK